MFARGGENKIILNVKTTLMSYANSKDIQSPAHSNSDLCTLYLYVAENVWPCPLGTGTQCVLGIHLFVRSCRLPHNLHEKQTSHKFGDFSPSFGQGFQNVMEFERFLLASVLKMARDYGFFFIL